MANYGIIFDHGGMALPKPVLQKSVAIGSEVITNGNGIAMGANISAANDSIVIGHGLKSEEGMVMIGQSGMKAIICGENLLEKFEAMEQRIAELEKCLDILWYRPGSGPGAEEAEQMFEEHSAGLR
jgi:hypothetical protein